MPSRKRGLNHLPISPDIARAATEMDNAQRGRALDKMHIDRMTRAMMGILVSFAMDDEQGLRASAWLCAHGAHQLGATREKLLEIVGIAFDLVAEDLPVDPDANAKPSGLVILTQ
jgi:alkylhydroperoxidase/carboxymuconolactone decarboxylase family protein YurZ